MATSDHIAPFVPLGTATVYSMAVQDRKETHLVKEYGKKCLEKQQYNFADYTSLRGEALHEWRGVFEGDNDETEDHGNYGNDWSFDYNVDEKRIPFRRPRDTNWNKMSFRDSVGQ